MEPKYIYESPDNGKTIYRRKFGEDDKELLYEASSDIPKCNMELDQIRKSKKELEESLIKLINDELIEFYNQHSYSPNYINISLVPISTIGKAQTHKQFIVVDISTDFTHLLE